MEIIIFYMKCVDRSEARDMKVTSAESGEMFIIFFSNWGDFLLMDC